ncbi:MAG: peptidoglycan -binding protein [Pseudomonadota bacterium]
MALTRRSGSRFETNIWPGFVDAMTALLLVLMFVLSIFMIIQFVLRDQVVEQERELDDLSGQIAQLAGALGLEQQRGDRLETQIGGLSSDLVDAEAQAAAQAALISTLTQERDSGLAQIASFEEQVAGLLARNQELTDLGDRTAAERDALAERNAEQLSANEALTLALAQARDELDVGAEEARLAAARREAMEALLADLSQRAAAQEEQIAAQTEALSDAEAARALEAAAAETLRERLREGSAELTALTLRLEAERKRAEDTLTLLAAANAARATLEQQAQVATEAASEAETQAALLELARQQLAEQEAASAEDQRRVALLNQQTAALSQQLLELQGLLDEAKAAEEAANVRVETLGADLNTALARVAAEQRAVAEEQRRRAELEEAERLRLEAEAEDLENYRSEFFGRVREILGEREGIQIVGDRFVFSSEVLFQAGSAALGPQGRQQLGEVAAVIREIRGEIPEGINWILRVDGHTDNIPIFGGAFADNWELSQARALSVVRYLIAVQDIPADRLAANGFGEFQPVDPADTDEARARNRRIELKFTER